MLEAWQGDAGQGDSESRVEAKRVLQRMSRKGLEADLQESAGGSLRRAAPRDSGIRRGR